jgi:hypothetical protein
MAGLVDREGNIWIGDTKGIHRFFSTPLIRQEFPKETSGVRNSPWLLMTMGRYGSVSAVLAIGSKLTFIQMLAVGPDYLRTMKIPLLGGRLLTETDPNGAKRALVNRAFVTKFLSGRNPVGLHFGDSNSKPDTEIVGVVGDTKYLDLRSDDAPTAFVPLAPGLATFEVRTALAPAALMAAVRKVVNAVDANLPVMRMRTQTDAIDPLLFNEHLWRGSSASSRPWASCSPASVSTACSYEAERRTREIGIRTALGARAVHHLVHGGASGNCFGGRRSAGGLRRVFRRHAPAHQPALCRAPNRPGHVRSHSMSASPGRNPGLFVARAAHHPRRPDGRSALRVAKAWYRRWALLTDLYIRLRSMFHRAKAEQKSTCGRE